MKRRIFSGMGGRGRDQSVGVASCGRSGDAESSCVGPPPYASDTLFYDIDYKLSDCSVLEQSDMRGTRKLILVSALGEFASRRWRSDAATPHSDHLIYSF